MNEIGLFSALRVMNGALSQQQVDSVNAILEACNEYDVIDERQIAYIIATAYHEARLKPVSEIGKGAGHPYGSMFKMTKDANGNHIPYTEPKQIYYGRGLVQTTWFENYDTFGNLLKIDLLNNPDLALQTDYAAEIIVVGMKRGMFTGVGLLRYFNDQISDSFNARRIVNGVDCAGLIQGYYRTILDGMNS